MPQALRNDPDAQTRWQSSLNQCAQNDVCGTGKMYAKNNVHSTQRLESMRFMSDMRVGTSPLIARKENAVTPADHESPGKRLR
jgi:hypothetical protein